MNAQTVILVFDAGKTNKKWFLLDEAYRVVCERSVVLPETVDEDGFPCEDLAALRAWVLGSLREVLGWPAYEVKAVNFSAYGSALVLQDQAGQPLAPIYNYLKPYPPELVSNLYRKFGGEEQLTAEIASPVLGSLNAGLQIYRLKVENPGLFKKIKFALHLPQYLSFLLTGEYYSDLTSIGCHSALWNFTKNGYHDWVVQEGLDKKLAPVVPGDTVSQINFEGHRLSVGTGMHDSSAALVPYFLTFETPFILVSTGTWCVAMNPFNALPLTRGELQQGCLCYLRRDGRRVKASRLFLGEEYQRQVRQIAAHFNVDTTFLQAVPFDPGIPAGPLSDDRDPGLFPDASTAYHQLMAGLVRRQEQAIRLISKDTSPIFVDGGFSSNLVYMHYLAAAFPDRAVAAAIVPQASAIGAALAIHSAWNSRELPGQIIQLKRYPALKLIKALCLAALFLLPAGKLTAQVLPGLAKASWISGDLANDSCPVFQKTFTLSRKPASAKLYITAHGLYEAAVNGQKIGDAYFTPGWTNYNKRLQYQVYEVSKPLHPGNNQLQVTLSGGWYSGVFGEDMKTANYGKGMALLCSLAVTYADGSKQIIHSDSTWRCGTGPIVYSDFYGGETQDTRVKAKYAEKVNLLEIAKANLIPTLTAPVTAQEIFKPKKVWTNIKGEQLIDFGQNMAGFVRLNIQGKAGDTVRISHAELLDNDGSLFTGNLRDAKATDTYVLNGRQQVLEPHFTYHGFRYAKITGIRITKDQAVAVAVHSQLKVSGTFSCSDPMLNQLQHNIQWSMNSNFVDIPTDCPQRSERFGWTGDAQLFCATAAFNRDVLDFYKKYLADLKADQGTNGAVPVIIPDLEQPNDTIKHGVAGWGDAATIMPWTLYQVYGDKSILADQYASMKAWVDYMTAQSPNYLWKANGYGDWYAMGDTTSLPFIDQCFYYHSTELLIDAAKVLGKSNESETYTALAGKIKTAFQQTYHFGTKATRTQTAYILALQFGLLPETDRQRMADTLVKRIHENNDHLATGFLGTPYLLPVLTQYGYTKLAYTLLLQPTCPSWLYPITKGATTIWERWDAIKPDGTIQQTSFNHYAYGAVGQWLYENMAGIKPAAPGYKKIIIHPQIGGGLTWAKASYTCKYGKIVSEWKRQGEKVRLHVEIPPHTTALIYMSRQTCKVAAGHYNYTYTKINN